MKKMKTRKSAIHRSQSTRSVKRLTAVSAVNGDEETSPASSDSIGSDQLTIGGKDGETGALVTRTRRNVLEVDGIQIMPASVIFEDAFEGQSYTSPLRLLNVSSKAVFVRIAAPHAWAFKVRTLVGGIKLAPGMQIVRRVKYMCVKNSVNTSKLPVYVNNNLYEIPLIACRSKAVVDISPLVLNFGSLDLGSKAVEQYITVRNLSSCATKITVDTGSYPSNIIVAPIKARVRPQSTFTITVRLIPIEEGHVYKEIWVLADRGTSRVSVTAEVYRRNLLVVHPNTTGDFTLIDFKPTFYGCERNETFIAYNKAAVDSYVVVLAEINNTLLTGLDDVHCKKQEFRMFKVEPEEGKLLPFEGRIFTVRFTPVVGPPPEKGWKSKVEAEETTSSFLVMIKLLRILAQDCDKAVCASSNQRDKKCAEMPRRIKMANLSDFQSDDDEESKLLVKSATCKPEQQEQSTRLCLYGEAEVPRVTVQPDELYFTDITVDAGSECRVLHMTNKSSKLPLAIRYVKTAGFEAEPNFQFIKPSVTFDIAVTFKAHRHLGKYSKTLQFEVLAYYDMTTNESLKVVSHVKVTVHVTSSAIGRHATTTSITPAKPEKINTKTALPNSILNQMKLAKDQRRTNYEIQMTYTPEEMLARQMHKDWYLQWMRGTAAQLQKQQMAPAKVAGYDINCRRMYLMTGSKGSKDDGVETQCRSRLQDAMPRDVMVPLTILQLYNIKIVPLCISFGMVTTSRDCTQPLTINNCNQFSIGVRFLIHCTGIKVDRTKDIVVNPMSEETVLLTFKAKKLGQYTETLTVVINEYHTYEVTAVAEVVPKTLTLDPKTVEINTIEDPFSADFYPIQVGSSLSTPVNFSWDIPPGSAFKIEPLSGIVPKQSSVYCALYFDPDSPNYKMGSIRLLVDGVKCHTLHTTTLFQRPSVYFMESVLNVGTLPLNMITLRHAVMFNAGYSDVMFVVLNPLPVNGVAIHPIEGIIKARSCINLKVYFTVEQVTSLDFLVYITVQTMITLELKITGTVVYPVVEIKPNHIKLAHVPCYSANRTSLVAHNLSAADVRIHFNMTDYPQFHVSLNRKPNDPPLSGDGVIIKPGNSQKLYLHFLPRDLASYDFCLPVILNDLISTDKEQDVDVSATHRGRMGTQLFKKTAGSITARNKQKNYSFGRSASCTTSMTPEVSNKHLVFVDCTVSKALAYVSETELLLTEGDGPKSFTLRNETSEPLRVRLHVHDLPSGFTIMEQGGVDDVEYQGADRGTRVCGDVEKDALVKDNETDMYSGQTEEDLKEERRRLSSSGQETTLHWQLEPGEMATIVATYSPVPGSASCTDFVDLNITVDGHAGLYNTTRLKGESRTKNRLSISDTEVYLTPVPLYVHVESLLSLRLEEDGGGWSRPNTAVCVQHTVQEPYDFYLKVTYLMSNCFTEQSNTLPVTVAFSSKEPVSFKAQVRFVDDLGNSCEVLVYATADNSLLTTHAFLCAEFGRFRTLHDRDKERVSATPQAMRASASPMASVYSDDDDDDDMDVVSARMSSQLLQYAMSDSLDEVSFRVRSYVVQDVNIAKLRRTMIPKQAMKQPKLDSPMKPDGSTKDDVRKTMLETIIEQSSLKDVVKTSERSALPVPVSLDCVEYPLFPLPDQVSEDAFHMKKTMAVVERWIYEQGFNCSFNPTLDDRIFTTFAEVVKGGQRSKRGRSVMRNVLDLLERLYGHEVRRYFTPIEKMPTKDPDRVVFIHNTYTRVIEFVQAQGGLMCHVEPHLLMFYDDYVTHVETAALRDVGPSRSLSLGSDRKTLPPPPLLDRQKFQSLSKQCWLDVMLQTIKCLMVVGPNHRQTVVDHGIATQKIHKYPKRLADTENLSRAYSKFELELLSWLNHHYSTQRVHLWGKETCPPPRNVTNFDQDLEDCLVLTAVTAAYCPYLTSLYFDGMFVSPESCSQAYHNAVCLTSAWHRIRLGFSVLPRDFTPPNTVHMVLLVAHLFHMLPTYVPETTVSFTSTLNTSDVKNIELDNPSDSPLTYVAHIIGDTCSFTVEPQDSGPFIAVKHKAKTPVAVKYTARKTTKVTGILLVCGASFPPKFGRNFAFNLEGHPVRLPVTSVFNIVTPLNTIRKTNVAVTTPHQPDFTTSKEIHYEIWYTETEPHPGEVNIKPWREVRNRKLPRRLHVLTERLEIPGGERHASGSIALQLTCFSMEQRVYWLVFTNRKVGDFIVKIVSKVCEPPPQADQLVGEVSATTPCHIDCIPAGSGSFERICYVDVPCRDTAMWSAVKNTLELTLTDPEKKFWSTHLRTNIGLHLLNWILVNDGEDANYNEIKHLFVKRQTYHVTLTPSDNLTVGPTLIMEDVRLEGTTRLVVHVGEDCSLPVTATLRMRTADGNQARCYKICITKPTKS